MKIVELIPKESVMNDIIKAWCESGRSDNRSEGAFIFENVDLFLYRDGVIQIERENKTYYYNMADFYRVKVIDVHS